MNEQEKLIREIKEEFEVEKHTKSYERVKDMAKIISENLYSEDSHFIYELIQNAQDNDYKEEKKKLDFFVYPNAILIKNNEIGFNSEQIRSICDFAKSVKKGKKALGYIGEKGIGFKSVFAITDQPAIYSNGYRFFFKKNEYIEPYWLEDLSEYPKEFQDENSTNIYLPYSKDFKNQKDIEKKIRDIEPILLLFLDSLDEINIYNDDKHILAVSKSSIINDKQNIVTIYSGDKKDKFITYSKVINCKDSIVEEKRKDVKKRQVIVAFPLQEIDDTRIFSFLPTEINTGLPFLIQADFLLNASRGDILKDKDWNKWLLEEIVDFFIDAFKDLRKTKNYLYYLKEKSSRYDFFDDYYQDILGKLKDEKLFLTTDNQWVSANEICILDDYDFMIDYLDDINYNNKFYTHKDFYIPKNLMNLWEIEIIDKDKFLTLLGMNREDIASKLQENNLLFEKLVKYISQISKYYLSHYDLSSLPLIPLDDNGKITFESKDILGNTLLFFKLDEKGVLNEIFDDIKYISKKYYQQLEKISFYSDNFGIKQPDLIQILENLNSDILNNIENNVKLLVYIKNNLGNRKDEILNLLRSKYKFFNKDNSIIGYTEVWKRNSGYINISPLYISKDYLESNNNCIENFVNKYCIVKSNKYFSFISNKYLEYDKENSDKDINDLKQEWRIFFSLLNINDNLKLVTEEIEMTVNDSQGDRRRADVSYENIPYIIVKERKYSYGREEFHLNLDLENLNLNDSIFFFKKIIGLSNIDSTYRKLIRFYREYKYTTTTVPWIEFIQNNYPIYIKNKQYRISDLYLSVDKKINKFFHTIPSEYIENPNLVNRDVFKLRDKPSKEDILSLIENEKPTNIKEAKDLFFYIKQHFDEVSLSKIPIDGKETLEYLNTKHLIWENGKELNLIDVKPSYGKNLKSFFIDTIGIQEKSSVEQYIEFLKTRPKKYKATFYKFIQQLDKSLTDGKLLEITSLKLCKIGSNYYSFNEIIYNDEQFETNKIENLLTVDKKYHSVLLNIADKYNIEKMSNFDREIVIDNIEDDTEIYNIYIKLLNFTWDYVFSKDINEFEKLKGNRAFVLETKKVENGAWANIDLKIYVDDIEVDISQDIELKDNTLYLSHSIDPRAKIKIISQYIAKQINISFEAIELFYKDVYLLEDSYTIEEYYQNNDIQRAKENDSFNNVFQKVLSDIEKELNKEEEEESESEEESSEPIQTLQESLEKNQSDGKSPEVTTSQNKPTEIINDKQHTKNINKENKTVVPEHTRVARTVRQDKDEQKQKLIIRDFLYKEYDGHCQICGDTFAYKFKNALGEFNNFKRFSLNRGKNRDVGRKGNSISLCLKHHRIFELNLQTNSYLDIFNECSPLSLDCIDTNNKIFKEDWISEDDIEYENKIYKTFYQLKKGELFMRNNIYFLPIKLFGEDESIKFTKAHLMEFIEVWNEN